jgi:hypothetical protein
VSLKALCESSPVSKEMDVLLCQSVRWLPFNIIKRPGVYVASVDVGSRTITSRINCRTVVEWDYILKSRALAAGRSGASACWLSASASVIWSAAWKSMVSPAMGAASLRRFLLLPRLTALKLDIRTCTPDFAIHQHCYSIERGSLSAVPLPRVCATQFHEPSLERSL